MKLKSDTVAIASNKYQRRSTELRQQVRLLVDLLSCWHAPSDADSGCKVNEGLGYCHSPWLADPRDLAQITLRHDVDKFPLLPPAAPSQQVAPFRGQGEKVK
eukprot:764961-Hanusia_phi.AAC.3